MFKKAAASLAIASTLVFSSVSAQASQVRPAAVKLDTTAVKSVSAQGKDARVATRAGKSNRQGGESLLLPLLGVAAGVAVIAVVASGGGDSSPN